MPKNPFRNVPGAVPADTSFKDGIRAVFGGIQTDDNKLYAGYQRDADAAAATTTSERVMLYINGEWTLQGVDLAPASSITLSSSNYGTVFIYRRNEGGELVDTVAQLTTNGSGTFQAFQQQGFDINAQANECKPGDILTFEITKGGSGVQLPAQAYGLTFLERT